VITVVPVASAGASPRVATTATPIGALLASLADPQTTAFDLFGYSVAVSGTTAVVGAEGTNSGAGAAYIYVKGASGWPTKPTKTLAVPAGSVGFGYSVAVSGTTAVVGATDDSAGFGAAYIYVKGALAWPITPTKTLAAPAGSVNFGYSVAVSGTTAVVGTDNNGGFGSAYIYAKGALCWPTTPTKILAAPAGSVGFGYSVAVSGTTAVVGAYATTGGFGSAYIYAKGALGWPTTPAKTLAGPAGPGFFGFSVAASGTTVVVGAPLGGAGPPGRAYIYVKGVSTWPTKPTKTLAAPAGSFSFGYSVAASGTTVVVGADGSAYMYVKGVSGWPTTPTKTLATPAGSASLGSVAASGTTVVVGADATNSNAGSVYIYNA
jgi:hypothetical protein